MTNGTTMTQAEKMLTEWMERQDHLAGASEARIAFGEDDVPVLSGILVADLDRATIATLNDWAFALRAGPECEAVETLRVFLSGVEAAQTELDALVRDCPEPGVVS
jgi:hypothetical protein